VVGACSTYGGEERCIWGFGGKPDGERDHLEDLSIDGGNTKIELEEVERGRGLD
jgi:hypothetical protein